MKKLIFWVIGIVIGVALILILGIYLWGFLGQLKINNAVIEINRSIMKELPLGTDVSKVNQFLASRKLESGILDEFQTESNFQLNSKLNGKREKIKYAIGAIQRDVSSSLFISGSIRIYFYFDEQHKLVEYTVEALYTGP